jgi:hypothetical protein
MTQAEQVAKVLAERGLISLRAVLWRSERRGTGTAEQEGMI